MNLNVSVQQVLGLIHHGGKDAGALNEIIEEDVKKLIEHLKIDDIEGYVDDHSIMFKKVAQPRAVEGTEGEKKMRLKVQRRMLDNSASLIASFVAAIFLVLI